MKYQRFINPKDIEEVKLFKPVDNRNIIALATPNSYHKAFNTKGTRKFFYIAYKILSNKNCWKTPYNWINNNNCIDILF